MANRNLNQVQSLYHKAVLLGGKISLSAAAAVSSSDLVGMTVAKTGTGEYTITLADKWSKLINIGCSVVDSTQDLVVVYESVSLTSKTFKVITKVAGSAANVTDACDLYLQVLLSNSSVD
jgi:hypothetical protein